MQQYPIQGKICTVDQNGRATIVQFDPPIDGLKYGVLLDEFLQHALTQGGVTGGPQKDMSVRVLVMERSVDAYRILQAEIIKNTEVAIP